MRRLVTCHDTLRGALHCSVRACGAVLTLPLRHFVSVFPYYVVDTTTNQTQTRCKSAAKWSATLVARHPTAAETHLSPFCRLIAGVGGRRRVHLRAQVRRIVRAALQMCGGGNFTL